MLAAQCTVSRTHSQHSTAMTLSQNYGLETEVEAEVEKIGDVFDLQIYSKKFCESAYFRAIVTCNLSQFYKAFYEDNLDVTLVDETFGGSFLHLVCSTAQSFTEDKFVPFIYALCNFWVDPNLVDHSHRTALYLAVSQTLTSLAVALLRCGALQTPDVSDVLIAECGPFQVDVAHWLDVFRPDLWEAVLHNSWEDARRLILCWCKIRISRDGQSLLAMAMERNVSTLLVELLESERATIEFVHASLAGDERKMLEILQNRNVNRHVTDEAVWLRHRVGNTDKTSKTSSKVSLRLTVQKMGHTHVLHLLPERKTSTLPIKKSLPSPKKQVEVAYMSEAGQCETSSVLCAIL